jgi:vacuolar protein sorting-associated protein 72
MPVLDRERRSTAGKRLTELGGQEAEDDAAFWGHETWHEDSDNESFHSSDEDSEIKKDVFDSDFDESESDREEEDAAAGDEEDKEIARVDKKRKESKSSYSDVVVGKMARGKRMKGVKRIIGDGLNAGIVLNVPSVTPSVAAPFPLITSSTVVPTSSSTQTVAPPAKPARKVTLASTRPRRADQLPTSSNRTRTARVDSTAATGYASSTAQPLLTTSSSSSSPQNNNKKKKRHRHTQEELLLEAAHETEGENIRWLLARKRYQEEQKDNEGRMEGRGRGPVGKLIMQYTSRKGYLNTITFPEMDHVPEILTRRDSQAAKYPKPTYCVITGLKACYKDPLTGLGYHDLAAFKELRRRSDAGEPLDQRKLKARESNSAKANSSSAIDCSQPPKLDPTANGSAAPNNSDLHEENGSSKTKPKGESSQQSSSHLDAIRADYPAEPAPPTNLSRKPAPCRRKPSTKVRAAEDNGILTNVLQSPSPATVSPSRPSQFPQEDLGE